MRMLRLSGLDSDDMTDDTARRLRKHGGESRDRAGRSRGSGGSLPRGNRKTDRAGLRRNLSLSWLRKRPSLPPMARLPPILLHRRFRPRSTSRPNGQSFPILRAASALTCCWCHPEFFKWAARRRTPGLTNGRSRQVTLSRFYMSRLPITNAQYELFDPSHARKRAPGAGDRHPVVYVSSIEATKFCQWLSSRDRRRYRLPTEAEWEYAARGTDGRKYPWGKQERRGDLANFADRNTVFAWSDREIDDGFAESSPVGAFPLGASPFGMEDMAGNVWEWCQRLHGSLPRHFQNQPARTAFGRETDLSGRELEVALQQPAGNDAWRQYAKLFLQRSRFPDRLRVRSVDVSLRETQSRLPLVRKLPVRKSKSHRPQTTKPGRSDIAPESRGVRRLRLWRREA